LIKWKKLEQGQHLHKGMLGQESQLSLTQIETWNILNMGWKLLNHIYNLNQKECLHNNKGGIELTQNGRKVTNLSKYKKID